MYSFSLAADFFLICTLTLPSLPSAYFTLSHLHHPHILTPHTHTANKDHRSNTNVFLTRSPLTLLTPSPLTGRCVHPAVCCVFMGPGRGAGGGMVCHVEGLHCTGKSPATHSEPATHPCPICVCLCACVCAYVRLCFAIY